jgi:protein-tyrosine kinase
MTAHSPPDDASAATSAPRERARAIGAILVHANRLDSSEVHQIQTYASKAGLRFGDAAVRMNLLTPEDIEFALERQFNYPLVSHGPDGVVADDVVAAYNPSCEAAEDLRTVRSRLVLGWLKQSSRNALAIVSPDRHEGRSWLAANLAVVFAQAGERTLLIDTDMRHSQQHVLFNLNNDVGLSALLTGRAGREIARRVHPQLRLFVVPAGIAPPNPQELLTRPVFDIVLEGFAKQFDLVVLDTPAVGESADAEILAARAGTAIMLTRRNHTHHARLRAAMDTLVRSGTQVIGSVINEH